MADFDGYGRSLYGTQCLGLIHATYSHCGEIPPVRGVERTCARHVLVMEPLTVLYGFDALTDGAPAGRHCVDPGRPARLKVTCVNNTPADAEVTVTVSGEGIARTESEQLSGTARSDLIRDDGPLRLWTDGKGERPDSACELALDYECPGVPSRPIHVEVRGKEF